jgi:PAS domain-containing protein
MSRRVRPLSGSCRTTARFVYEDLPLESKLGDKREVEIVANRYDEDGTQVVQCNVRDITERKRTESALRASEERFRTLEGPRDRAENPSLCHV